MLSKILKSILNIRSLRTIIVKVLTENHLTEVINTSAVKSALPNYPKVVLDTVSRLDPKEIAQNNLNQIIPILECPATWFEYSKEPTYAKKLCSLPTLWKPLLLSNRFDEKIVSSPEFRDFLLNSSKTFQNYIGEQEFIQISLNRQEIVQTIFDQTASSPTLVEKLNLQAISEERKFIKTVATNPTSISQLLQEETFAKNLVQNKEFNLEALTNQPEYLDCLLKQSSFICKLIRDTRTLEILSKNQDLLLYVISEDSIADSLTKNENNHNTLIHLLLSQTGDRQKQTIISILSHPTFKTAVENETDTLDPILRIEAAVESIARSEEILDQIATDKTLLKNLIKNFDHWFYQEIARSDQFKSAITKDKSIASQIATIEALIEPILKLETAVQRIARFEPLLDHIISDRNVCELLFTRLNSEFFVNLVGCGALEKAIENDERLSLRLSRNPCLIKTFIERIQKLEHAELEALQLALSTHHEFERIVLSNKPVIERVIKSPSIRSLLCRSLSSKDVPDIENNESVFNIIITSYIAKKPIEDLLRQSLEKRGENASKLSLLSSYLIGKIKESQGQDSKQVDLLFGELLTKKRFDLLLSYLTGKSTTQDISWAKSSPLSQQLEESKQTFQNIAWDYLSRSRSRLINLIKENSILEELLSDRGFRRKIASNPQVIQSIATSPEIAKKLIKFLKNEQPEELLVQFSDEIISKTKNQFTIDAVVDSAYNNDSTIKALLSPKKLGFYAVSFPKKKIVKDSKNFFARLNYLEFLFGKLKPWLDKELFETNPYYEFIAGAASATDNLWNYINRYIAPSSRLKFSTGNILLPDTNCLRILLNEIFIAEEYGTINSSKKPRILDIGAHIGLASIYFKAKYPESKIDCYEPNQQNFSILTENLKNLKLEDVTAHNSAVSTYTGKATFYPSPDDSMAGSLESSATFDPGPPQNASTIALSELIDGPMDLLKIDAEGAEYGLLMNTSATKLKLVKNLIFEFHHRTPESSRQLNDILINLSKLGFTTIQNGSYSTSEREIAPLGSEFKKYSSLIRAYSQ